MDIQAIWLTAKLALVTTLILMVVAVPMAWWLSRWQGAGKALVQAIIALPLVLPPTVLGFYLLIAFSPNNAFGQGWQALFGSPLAFTFEALVIGSVLYSLPFAVQPLHAGFSQLQPALLETAAMLNVPSTARWRYIILPAMLPHALIAAGLSFAHTIGEFGVVLMIGGNIPGETRVASIALFDHVEALDYTQAHQLAAVLLVVSLLLLIALYWRQGKGGAQWRAM
ncbi:molybdate ABC transporter permease subunit [Aestuariibacter sp. GS-14]|uniref:molybdate ABC transporter permease subunit n=1 Tax=Aestuariibacter sp. GS-14 TaxID=2590670 RepID=UPI001126C6F1|nr:molybdate ABC transporter permease subunit [Aestuariibacter sp. GS-14]TPV60864.1 molybdate ABC transporter permease subunit [Aestuariibacter sp. GS-14]